MTFTIKIYKLTNTANNSFYVGSTKESLCKRMGGHRAKSKLNRMSKLYKMMREVGVEHWQITLIEAFEVSTFEEQRQREREVMERVNPDLNEKYAYRSPEETKEQEKQYGKRYAPVYYQENKNEIKNKSFNYYHGINKEQVKTRQRNYAKSEAGKATNERRKTKVRGKCDCCNFSSHLISNYNHHMQTARHKRKETAYLFAQLPFY